MFILRQKLIDNLKNIVSISVRRKIKLHAVGVRRHFFISERPLPNLLIIGAMRSGTSSLFKYLESHPDTAASLRKEVQFFTRYWQNGSDWYRAHFPITKHRLAFEATPDYLFHPLAASRAAQTVPDAKLIVLLREPVARAWSHYDHMVRLGFERRSFARALEEEDYLVEDARANLERDEHIWQPLLLRHSYLSRSHYAGQLEKWLEFFPGENFLILWSEDLYNQPTIVMNKIAEFLSIGFGKFSGVERNYSRHMRGGEGRRKRNEAEASVPPWALVRLHQENERLAHLLRNRFPAAASPPWLDDKRACTTSFDRSRSIA